MRQTLLFFWLIGIVLSSLRNVGGILPVEFGEGLFNHKYRIKPNAAYQSVYHNFISSPTRKWVESFFKGACECGKERRFTRITGGTETAVNQYPWMSGIFKTRPGMRPEFVCGATLISSHYIVTASHCVSEYASTPEELFCVLGDHNITSDSETPLPPRVLFLDSIVLHPLYNWHNTFEYDVALLRLTMPIEFEAEAFIRPICLPERSLELRPNMPVIAVGWGYQYFGGRMSDVLRHVALQVTDTSFCKKSYMTRFPFDEKAVLCAGDIVRGGRDACQGDSGGPLMFYQNSSYYLVGITSVGTGCGDPKYPGIYTNIVNTYLRSFIDLSFLDFSSGYPVRTCHEDLFSLANI